MNMEEERFDQICNHVMEEFVDQKKVNFASKKEFCEVILKLLERLDEYHVARPAQYGPLTLLDTMLQGDSEKMAELLAQMRKSPPRMSALLSKEPIPEGMGFNWRQKS